MFSVIQAKNTFFPLSQNNDSQQQAHRNVLSRNLSWSERIYVRSQKMLMIRFYIQTSRFFWHRVEMLRKHVYNNTNVSFDRFPTRVLSKNLRKTNTHCVNGDVRNVVLKKMKQKKKNQLGVERQRGVFYSSISWKRFNDSKICSDYIFVQYRTVWFIKIQKACAFSSCFIMFVTGFDFFSMLPTLAILTLTLIP